MKFSDVVELFAIWAIEYDFEEFESLVNKTFEKIRRLL